MLSDKTFTDNDKTQVIEFLNFIANKAVFPDWKTEDTVKHFKLLAHMQQQILPKIEANILELKSIKNPPEEKKEEKPSRKKEG